MYLLSREKHFDIAVLGGGPAGCVTALLLARLGHRVALVARPRRTPTWEGLSERAVNGLRTASCARALEAVGCEVRRCAAWNGQQSTANRERIVERMRFDRALQADASQAGVDVLAGRAGRPVAIDSGWRIAVQPLVGSADPIHAAFLVEARGRQAALQSARRIHGPPTVALSRLWKLPAGAPARTSVAAFPNGWAWFAAGGDDSAVLQLIVSGERGHLPGRPNLPRYYDQLLAQVVEADSWLAGATPDDGVTARNAAPMLTEPAIEERSIRVGDAGMAIDPLSGHGIFEAIGSAFAAAPVINTILRRPKDARLACNYFQERTTQSFMRNARVGREFYAGERRWAERSFWRARRIWPDTRPAHEPPFSGEPRIAEKPVVQNSLVTLAEVVVTPDHPRGVWQVAGVTLVSLIRVLEAGPLSLDAAAKRLDQSPDAVRTAWDWLRYRRLA